MPKDNRITIKVVLCTLNEKPVVKVLCTDHENVVKQFAEIIGGAANGMDYFYPEHFSPYRIIYALGSPFPKGFLGIRGSFIIVNTNTGTHGWGLNCTDITRIFTMLQEKGRL